jgi:hypothetical protein
MFQRERPHSSETNRWWIYPLKDGTLQAAPDTPTWGGGGTLVMPVEVTDEMVKTAQMMWDGSHDMRAALTAALRVPL